MKILSDLRSIITILVVMITTSLTAQVELNADDLSADWQLINETNGVKIYFSKQECQMGSVEQPFIYGFLKVVNTTGNEISLNYRYNLQYEDGCVGCGDSDEYDMYQRLSAGETLEGDCSFKNDQLVLLLKNPLQYMYTELKSVEIINIKVEQL